MTGCADRGIASGEPIAGTAFQCRALVALPLDKPRWGRDAVAALRGDPSLAAWIDAARGRPVAVKAYDARSAPFGEGIAIVARPDGVVLCPLEALPEPDAICVGGPLPGTGRLSGRLRLVCAHGQRDRCCALHGFGVTRALRAAGCGTVVECSHLGGDRFAATALSFPGGDMLGWLRPSTAVRTVAALDAGVPPADRWRGNVFRSDAWAVVMAALRREAPGRAVDGLTLEPGPPCEDRPLRGRARLGGAPHRIAAHVEPRTHHPQPDCARPERRIVRVHWRVRALVLAAEAGCHA